MKSKLLLTVFVCMALSACKKDNAKPSQKLQSVTGSMTTTVGQYSDQPFIVDQEVYNEEGKIISSIKGNITYTDPYSYYPTYYFYKDGKLSEVKDKGDTKSEYLYNDRNQVIEMNTYLGDYHQVHTLLGKEEYAYDAQGRRVKKTVYNYRPGYGYHPTPPSTAGYSYTYEYNANNQVSKETDQGGGTNTYEYDGHQNLIKQTYSNSNTPNSTYANYSATYKYEVTGELSEIQQTTYTEASKIVLGYYKDGRVKTKNVYKGFGGSYYQVATINYEYTYF